MPQGFFHKTPEKKRQVSTVADRKGTSRTPKTFSDPCQECGLCDQPSLKNPKVKPYGLGKKGILNWAEAPGAEEDERGMPFVGQVGDMFRPYFGRYGIDFYEDCVTINAIDCRPPDNRKPAKKEIRCCYPRKREVLEQYRPRVVFLIGESAIDSFYGNDERRKSFSSLPLSSYRGKVIPDQTTGAWVCHSYHPSYIERGNQRFEHIFDMDFAVFASMVGKERPRAEDFEKDIHMLYDDQQVKDFLYYLLNDKVPFAFDYETSSYRYYEGIHELYMISVCYGEKTCVFRYTPGIRDMWVKLMESDVPKIIQNLKHERHASYYL